MRSLALTLLLVTVPPNHAFAGGGRNPYREPDESEFYELDEKLVTVASRYAQSLRKAPNLVTVIDEATLRARGYRTVADALRDLPGVYVWTSQEGRAIASFRGVVSADNNKILLLIDGVPLYDGVYGHAWIDDFLPIHHVSQIEVIKGPGSAIYGTNAFAGVINVVTARPEDLQGARVRAMAGASGRFDLGIDAGGTQEIGESTFGMSAFARALTSDGDGLDVTPRGRRNIRGEDPKRGLAVGATVEAEGFTGRLTHIDYRHSYLTQEQDDLFDQIGGDPDIFGLQYHATSIDLRYAARPLPGWVLTPRLFSQRHNNPGSYAFWGWEPDESGDLDTLDITVVETEKDTRMWGIGVDTEIRPHPNHVTVAGVGFDSTVVLDLADISYADFSGSGEVGAFQAPRGARLRNGFAYLSETWTLAPAVEITLGGRLDKRIPSNPDERADAAAFQLLASPRVGLLIAPSATSYTKVLYGRAFRHANVRETLVSSQAGEDGFYPFANGSLDLRPEQIDTVDLEVGGEPGEDVRVRAAGSWSTLRYEIDKVSPPNAYRNLDGALTLATAEAEISANAGPATFRAAYAFTYARYGALGPYADRAQFEYPPHMLKANIGIRPISTVSATLTGEVYSPRPRAGWAPDSGTRDGDAFGLLHLAVRASGLGKAENLEIVALARNLTDARYDTAVYRDEVNRTVGDPADPEPRYPQQHEGEGRNVHVAIGLRF